MCFVVSHKESGESGSRSSRACANAVRLVGLKFVTPRSHATDMSAYVKGVSGHLAGPSSHGLRGNVPPRNDISFSLCDDLQPADACVKQTGPSHDPPANVPL